MSSKNRHNQKHGSDITRSDDRINNTGEVFTPPSLCDKMIRGIPKSVLKDPTSTFLDNSAGNGNFVIQLKKVLMRYHSRDHIVNNMLYAVEFMEDNHKEMCERLGVPVDHPHYVNADALEYHYRFDGTIGDVTLDQFFE
tara:strand:- start:1467 stop:1883 length:417 start_codon:yes stop_codon:yes gene_type:complete